MWKRYKHNLKKAIPNDWPYRFVRILSVTLRAISLNKFATGSSLLSVIASNPSGFQLLIWIKPKLWQMNFHLIYLQNFHAKKGKRETSRMFDELWKAESGKHWRDQIAEHCVTTDNCVSVQKWMSIMGTA